MRGLQTLALLILAQAVSATPTAVPDDGPPPPTIVERIDAPVAAVPIRAVATPTPMSTPVPAPIPTPVRTTQVAPMPAAPPTPVPIAPPTHAARAVAPVVPRASASPSGGWGVHVSSFRKREVAEADARRMGAQQGLPWRVLEVDLGKKGVWYRAVLGEVGTAAEASALRDRLKAGGIPDGVVLRF